MKRTECPARAIALAAMLIAAAVPLAAPASAPAAASLARLEQLIAAPSCQVDADCAVIGIGSRPCGGPERYAAWSRRVSDEAVLKQAAARHAEVRRQADAAAGIAGTCVVLPQPAVRCLLAAPARAGRCELMPGQGGSGSSSAVR